MRIIVGSDHVGFPLKQAAIEYLISVGVDVTDAGTYSPEEPVDYPDYARSVCRAVASGEHDRGVLICGTGLGMSIAANRFPDVRAALCHDAFTAHQSRAHNDANVLCMGSWVVTQGQAEGILEEWLKTGFEEGRHTPRLAKLESQIPETPPSSGTLAEAHGVVKARFGIALSPRPSSFAPLLFAGRLTEGLRAAAEAGFEAVEISLRSPDDLSRDELRTMLNQYGLSLTAIATGQACLHDSLCLSDPRPKVRQAALDRLNSMIRLAAPFGAFTIIGGIRGRLTGREAEQKEQQRSAVEAIRECARLASGLGVTLLVEPINRYETNFINTADEGLRLLDEIAEPAVKLLLDTFHMNIEEPNLPLALRKAGTRLGALHLADSNRQAPGRGHIDFAPIFRALAEIRFAGPIAAEILPMPDDAAAVRLTADFLRVAVASRKQGVVTT